MQKWRAKPAGFSRDWPVMTTDTAARDGQIASDSTVATAGAAVASTGMIWTRPTGWHWKHRKQLIKVWTEGDPFRGWATTSSLDSGW